MMPPNLMTYIVYAEVQGSGHVNIPCIGIANKGTWILPYLVGIRASCNLHKRPMLETNKRSPRVNHPPSPSACHCISRKLYVLVLPPYSQVRQAALAAVCRGLPLQGLAVQDIFTADDPAGASYTDRVALLLGLRGN